MSVLILGSINLDLTVYVPELPSPGETLLGDRYITGPGGKGFNQAVAAGRLGDGAQFFGRIGDDPFGKEVLALTANEAIDLSGLSVDIDGSTGLAIINVDQHGENEIIVISGSNMRLDERDVTKCVNAMSKSQVLLLQLESPLEASLSAAREARAAGLSVIFDPAPARPLPDEAFQLATVMTPNESETEQLLGFRPKTAADAVKAGKSLCERGVEIAVIKLGANGVVWVSAENDGFVPPFSVDTIDTVAAGDAFNGALAVALVEEQAIAQAVRFAAAAGALATTKHGAAAAMPTRSEVDALLQAQV